MKKFLLLALVAVLGLFSLFGLFGVLLVSDSYAAGSDSAYVVVRCTVSLSIQVLPATNYVYFTGAAVGNGISAGEAWVSTNVIVANTGSGCIETWTLQVSTQHQSASIPVGGAWNGGWADTTTANAGWDLGTTMIDNGVNKVVLAACFKNAA